MKITIVTATVLFIMMSCLSITAMSESGKVWADSTRSQELTDARVLLNRLDIINATDLTNFSPRQKRILRKEAKVIKGNLKELRGGRYIRPAIIILVLIVPFSVYQMTE